MLHSVFRKGVINMEWQKSILYGMEFLFLGLGSYFDMKSRELPLGFLTVFGVCGLFLNLIWKYQTFELVLGSLLIGGLFLLIGKVTKEAIGYGDGLCFMILGIYEGWKSMIGILGAAFLLSGIYGIWKMLCRGGKSSDTIPFLPFLFLAQIGVLFI